MMPIYSRRNLYDSLPFTSAALIHHSKRRLDYVDDRVKTLAHHYGSAELGRQP
jgi:hypothetical protein